MEPSYDSIYHLFRPFGWDLAASALIKAGRWRQDNSADDGHVFGWAEHRDHVAMQFRVVGELELPFDSDEKSVHGKPFKGFLGPPTFELPSSVQYWCDVSLSTLLAQRCLDRGEGRIGESVAVDGGLELSFGTGRLDKVPQPLLREKYNGSIVEAKVVLEANRVEGHERYNFVARVVSLGICYPPDYEKHLLPVMLDKMLQNVPNAYGDTWENGEADGTEGTVSTDSDMPELTDLAESDTSDDVESDAEDTEEYDSADEVDPVQAIDLGRRRGTPYPHAYR